VALQEPDEPPLNTLLLVQRPGAEAHPGVLCVRDRLRDTACDILDPASRTSS